MTVQQSALRSRKLEAIARFQSDPDRWWLCRRELGDGRAVWLVPMTFGNLRLAVGPMDSCWFDDEWCYHDHDAAWRAALEWNGSGEPTGWVRHPSSGRRRPDGDAEREWVMR